MADVQEGGTRRSASRRSGSLKESAGLGSGGGGGLVQFLCCSSVKGGVWFTLLLRSGILARVRVVEGRRVILRGWAGAV